MSKILLFILVYGYCFSLQAIDLSKINCEYWYNPGGPVYVESRVSTLQQNIQVFLKISGTRFDSFNVEYLLQKSFEDEQDQPLDQLEIDTVNYTATSILISLNFIKSTNELLVAAFKKDADVYYFPVQLSRGGFSYPPFYPVDESGIPVTNRYINESKVLFQSMNDSDKQLYSYEYQENFNPADPPMGIIQKINPNLDVQSLSVSASGEFRLQNEYFYFFQNDTLSNFGLTLYSGNSFFPEYRTVAELIPPLTYISRPSELSELLLSENPKASFDEYWLRLFTTQGAAKAAIRGYYSRIFLTNRLFTDYKQGWKTDRGVIYIVFGKPVEVYRRNYLEVWRYEDGTVFEFRILSNLFAPNLYVLIRNEKYRNQWIAKTKALRGGE